MLIIIQNLADNHRVFKFSSVSQLSSDRSLCIHVYYCNQELLIANKAHLNGKIPTITGREKTLVAHS